MIFQSGSLLVRRLTEADLPQMALWESDPRVLTYFCGRDDPHDLEQLREYNFSPNDPTEFRCMIEFDDVPIGYIQFYTQDERGYPPHERTWGIDLYIGEPEYWGCGIGTQLVRATAEYCLRVEHADRVLIDPEAWNTRAIKCYEKAGFTKVRLLPQDEWHEGAWRDCWLMEYTKRDV